MPAPRKPGGKLSRPSVQFRADQEWIDLVTRAAQALGMTGGVSAYVREATERALREDGFGKELDALQAEGR